VVDTYDQLLITNGSKLDLVTMSHVSEAREVVSMDVVGSVKMWVFGWEEEVVHEE
jgi:hypothetical protein